MLIESELKALILKYEFTNDELYRHSDKLMLVSARGIRKIITTEKLNVSKRIEFDPTGGIAVIVRVESGNPFGQNCSFYEAVGEAKMGLNTSFKFPIAVAEARGNSRAVLSWAGLYEKGIIGEAELDQETEAETIIAKRTHQVDTAMADLTGKIKSKRRGNAVTE